MSILLIKNLILNEYRYHILKIIEPFFNFTILNFIFHFINFISHLYIINHFINYFINFFINHFLFLQFSFVNLYFDQYFILMEFFHLIIYLIYKLQIT